MKRSVERSRYIWGRQVASVIAFLAWAILIITVLFVVLVVLGALGALSGSGSVSGFIVGASILSPLVVIQLIGSALIFIVMMGLSELLKALFDIADNSFEAAHNAAQRDADASQVVSAAGSPRERVNHAESTPTDLYSRAKQLSKSGQRVEAIETLRELIRAHPASPEAQSARKALRGAVPPSPTTSSDHRAEGAVRQTPSSDQDEWRYPD